MPNFDEIDREYTRPRPSPNPGMDGYKKFVARWTRWSVIVIVVFAIGMALSAASDQIFRLGWGYRWRDFWGALAVLVFALVLYAIIRAWFALLGFDRLSSDEQKERNSLSDKQTH
jgi:hypothetical protein